METIVSFSGGKDSTAMLHLMLERGEHIDEVIYFDGGWDFPQMEEHVAKVEEKTGIKITRVTPRHGDFDYYATSHEYTTRDGISRKGYCWPVGKMRWCTGRKAEAIEDHLHGRDGIRCIGFAVGEEKRAKNYETKRWKCRYPLLEYNYDEVQCLQYCYKLGYDWGGLYNYFDRVSCYCCPMAKIRDRLMIKRHFPELWKEIERKNELICQVSINGQKSWKQDKTFIEIDSTLRGIDEPYDYGKLVTKKEK